MITLALEAARAKLVHEPVQLSFGFIDESGSLNCGMSVGADHRETPGFSAWLRAEAAPVASLHNMRPTMRRNLDSSHTYVC
jgi:hypothetical protein